MKIIDVALQQLPECHVPLSVYLADNIVTDNAGKNALVIPTEQMDTNPAKFTGIHGCLPMVLYQNDPDTSLNTQALALHAVVSINPALCTTVDELVSRIETHMAQWGQGSWQLEVGARVGLNEVAQLDLDDPNRDAFLDFLPQVEKLIPGVTVILTQIETEHEWDHLAFDPTHGFQRIVPDF